MSTKIEAGEGWLLGELDNWSMESGVKKEIRSGSVVHLGAKDDTAAVLVGADKGSARVTIYLGLRPLSVEISGIVSAIPMVDSQRPQILGFELKGFGAFVQIAQDECSTEGSIIKVTNRPNPVPLLYP